jgi:hypothetical protein
MYLIIRYLLVLHPRHKLDYFKKAGWKEEWIAAARQIVRDEFEQSYAEPLTDADADEIESMVCNVFDVVYHHLTKYLAVVLKAIQYILQSSFPCTSQGNRPSR